MPDSETRVIAFNDAGFRTTLTTGKFNLVADEPKSAGGTATGPTPYDYLAAALAACTAMTVRMYAERKGWPLVSVTVSIRYGKSYAQDCADCEKPSARIDRFERELTLTGELEPTQRQRLLEIAEHCPVHRTLQAQAEIETRLRTEAGR